MSQIAKSLWSGALQQHQMDVIELTWLITGTQAASIVGQKPEITYGFNAAGTPTDELGQTTIDNLIGSNIITAATSFGSTAMGTDAFGFVLSTKGQLDKLYYGRLEVYTTSLSTVIAGGLDYSVTSMPNTLPTAGSPRFAKTSTGDVAGLFVFTGLDALTSGFIRVSLFGRFK